MRTIWILGDQLNRNISSLTGATPGQDRILFINSEAKLRSKRWHRQRLHLVITAMQRFADDLSAEGFDVEVVTADSFAAGIESHRKSNRVDSIAAMEPLSWEGHQLMDRLRVDKVRSNQMMCHYDEFSAWSGSSKKLVMENFYRWQRQRYDVLMDGDQPTEGRWNFDSENREPPPKDGRSWPPAIRDQLDQLDRDVLASLPDNCFGDEPDGTWATSRAGAVERMEHFMVEVLPLFGPHEDAMLSDEWKLAHSGLSHALNIGLLSPHEVVDAAEAQYRSGNVGISSAEGFIRQILGWREYIWNVYWHYMPEYRNNNALEANRALPPLFTGAKTKMHCVSKAVEAVDQRAWNHHIQRLMVLGNLALTAGVEPKQMVEWMWASYIDGAEWVMIPNLVGMSLFADGGQMSTKPYASGGSYINKMSNYCKSCHFDPKKRTGDDACPFTTLYWDFLDRHRSRFTQNHRMSQQIKGIDRLGDMDAVRARAKEVLDRLDKGAL